MADERETFVRRWSRLKHQSNEPAPKADETPKPTLPPVEKLTPESDFSQFMHPKVEDALRRVALKKLFSDPHFNVPDPFEPFSGDWTVAEPISQEMLATLNQAKQHLFSDKQKEETESKEEAASGERENPADEPGKQDA
jgi:hypothetical protein